jgi:hypothetical protein
VTAEGILRDGWGRGFFLPSWSGAGKGDAFVPNLNNALGTPPRPPAPTLGDDIW